MVMYFVLILHKRCSSKIIFYFFLVTIKLVKNFVIVSDISLQYSRRNPLSELCEKKNRFLYRYFLKTNNLRADNIQTEHFITESARKLYGIFSVEKR